MLSVMAFNVATIAMRHVLPNMFYIVLFLFWRTAYNVGLGVVLTKQSKKRTITAWLDKAPAATKALVNWAVSGSLPSHFRFGKVPVEFNAWVAFRALAMLILANDGLTYTILGIIYFKPIAESSAIELTVCAVVGTALVVFSVWSKAAAHDCLGDFAWYWGDFFFIIEGELVFDGVFELFPHPMYTVGYAAYYGISLLARSYTIFFVSLIAHTMQIVFLLTVEEPHIQKTYGGPSSSSLSDPVNERFSPVPDGASFSRSESSLVRDPGDSSSASSLGSGLLASNSNLSASSDDDEVIDSRTEKQFGSQCQRQAYSRVSDSRPTRAHSFVPHAQKLPTKYLVGLWRPNLHHVGDVFLYMTLFTTIGFVLFSRPSTFLLVTLLAVWKACQWLGLGYLLHRQSVAGEWMATAAANGVAPDNAFAAWCQLWNTTWVMNHVVFVVVACCISSNPYNGLGDLVSPVNVSHILGGITLIWVSVLVMKSTYDTLDRQYGFFYTDFFLPTRRSRACYTGVLRYVNNPECMLGYLGYYGLGIILKSWAVTAVSFLCHAAHLAFVGLVETPHLNRTYEGVRGAAALERTIRTQAARVAEAVPVVGIVRDELKQTARRSRTLLTMQKKRVATAHRRLWNTKESLAAEIAALNVRLREHKLYLHAVAMQQRARNKIQRFDGEEIVSMLERHGIVIERVSDYTDSDDGAGSAGDKKLL